MDQELIKAEIKSECCKIKLESLSAWERVYRSQGDAAGWVIESVLRLAYRRELRARPRSNG